MTGLDDNDLQKTELIMEFILLVIFGISSVIFILFTLAFLLINPETRLPTITAICAIITYSIFNTVYARFMRR